MTINGISVKTLGGYVGRSVTNPPYEPYEVMQFGGTDDTFDWANLFQGGAGYISNLDPASPISVTPLVGNGDYFSGSVGYEATWLDLHSTSLGLVANVPEPASWAMMVGGFGMIGGALRSRRKIAVAFA